MALTSEGRRREAFLSKIVARALELLEESDNPQQEMRWAESRLREANLLSNYPSKPLSPQQWTQQCLALNLDLMDESIPWALERDSHPERVETFEGLILNLCPSEGGL